MVSFSLMPLIRVDSLLPFLLYMPIYNNNDDKNNNDDDNNDNNNNDEHDLYFRIFKCISHLSAASCNCLCKNHYSISSHRTVFGSVSTSDNPVFNSPLRCSLSSFARTYHSIHSLHSALLACSIHGLTHSFCSLCVHAVNTFKGKKRVFGQH